MAKVKLGLSLLNADEVVALANTIITAMNGNAHFASPNPSLATLTGLKSAAAGAIDTYNAARAAAEAALAAREAAIAQLCAALTQEAAYVENVSAGNPAQIESAGMTVRATAAPLPLTQVLNLVLSEGQHEGTLAARWQIVRAAHSYEVQISPDPMSASSWSYQMTASKGNAILQGLSSGGRVWVRVRAIGAANQPGPWSDPATKVVP